MENLTLKQYYVGQIITELSDISYWYKNPNELARALNLIAESAIKASEESNKDSS